MIVHAEVDENGHVKVIDPDMRGKKIVLATPEDIDEKPKGKTNWDETWNIFKEADALNFPRRSPEEITRELRAFRESGS